VRISSVQVISEDRFLYHKTTHRDVCGRKLAAAVKSGCDDALFFNERGELTKGAIHNIFIAKDGEWKTPPIQWELLPGTYRGKFLREHPNAREEVLALNDLIRADQIHVCNSVRGMYPVELVRVQTG
jgi:para-aminobenzoate synthetase/4-amino-4-deoxychorismate lyase